MPRTSDLGMDGLSGYLWLFVAVFGTVSLNMESTIPVWKAFIRRGGLDALQMT